MQDLFKTTSSLRHLQLKFGQLVSTQQTPVPKELDWISPQPPLSQQKRLDIYKNSWWLRLSESIVDDYETVVKCLGKVKFNKITREYLKEYPPHSYSLVHAGDQMPEFLEHYGDISRSLPWIIDLARFERADYQAYHAADSAKWDPGQLAQLPLETVETLRLRTQPSVSLLKSKWKISDLLKSSKKSTPTRSKTTCLPGSSYFVIYRDGFRTTHLVLKSLQYKLLRLAQSGATLNEWAECASATTNWVVWLGEWAKNGIIYPEFKPIQ